MSSGMQFLGPGITIQMSATKGFYQLTGQLATIFASTLWQGDGRLYPCIPALSSILTRVLIPQGGGGGGGREKIYTF